MAKMCVKPKKRHKPPVVFPYKKKFLGVGGRRVTERARMTLTRAAASGGALCSAPGAETSKSDPTNATYPRQQLFLTLQQLFQALDGVSLATRCTATALPVLALAASAPPPTLARCHSRQRNFWHTPMRAFSCIHVRLLPGIFLGDS